MWLGDSGSCSSTQFQGTGFARKMHFSLFFCVVPLPWPPVTYGTAFLSPIPRQSQFLSLLTQVFLTTLWPERVFEYLGLNLFAHLRPAMIPCTNTYTGTRNYIQFCRWANARDLYEVSLTAVQGDAFTSYGRGEHSVVNGRYKDKDNGILVFPAC